MESYIAPEVDCWVNFCSVEAAKQVDNPSPFGQVWDVFPATLNEFYASQPKEGGYTLAWDNKFPRQKDFDGDGLRNKADGGNDPDDSTPDADGDGLPDWFELEKGFDPLTSNTARTLADSPSFEGGGLRGGTGLQATIVDGDGDGLSEYDEIIAGTDPFDPDSDDDYLLDGEELAGWELVYALEPDGTRLTTWVTSDPLSPDADGDGLIDSVERLYGLSPWTFNEPVFLTLNMQLSEPSAPRMLLRFEELGGATNFADTSGQGHPAACIQDIL